MVVGICGSRGAQRIAPSAEWSARWEGVASRAGHAARAGALLSEGWLLASVLRCGLGWTGLPVAVASGAAMIAVGIRCQERALAGAARPFFFQPSRPCVQVHSGVAGNHQRVSLSTSNEVPNGPDMQTQHLGSVGRALPAGGAVGRAQRKPTFARACPPMAEGAPRSW